LAIDKARRGKIAHSYLTDEQRSLSPKEAAKMFRYLVPEALGARRPVTGRSHDCPFKDSWITFHKRTLNCLNFGVFLNSKRR